MATKHPLDADEILTQMTSEAVKQGENLRATVSDLTLKALQTRELSLAQIKNVVRSVTSGVNLGVSGTNIDVEPALAQALSGMDDALLKAVEANRLALQQVTGAGQAYDQSQLKKALDDLERLEDGFLGAVKQAADGAGKNLKAQWAEVLKHAKVEGTDMGQQAAATLEEFEKLTQANIRTARAAGIKAAYMMTQNFATLASGVLIGMSEALRQGRGSKKAGPKNED